MQVDTNKINWQGHPKHFNTLGPTVHPLTIDAVAYEGRAWWIIKAWGHMWGLEAWSMLSWMCLNAYKRAAASSVWCYLATWYYRFERPPCEDEDSSDDEKDADDNIEEAEVFEDGSMSPAAQQMQTQDCIRWLQCTFGACVYVCIYTYMYIL